jgi:hypothetical protein
MVYGVKVFNYLKGWYEVHVFDKRKVAKQYQNELEIMDWENPYMPLAEHMIASEDELSSKDALFEKNVTKNYPLSVNENGRVSRNLYNIRIINNNNAVEIPA